MTLLQLLYAGKQAVLVPIGNDLPSHSRPDARQIAQLLLVGFVDVDAAVVCLAGRRRAVQVIGDMNMHAVSRFIGKVDSRPIGIGQDASGGMDGFTDAYRLVKGV